MKKKKKKRPVPYKGIIVLIIIVLGAVFFITRLSGGRTVSPGEYFGVKASQAAVVVNGRVLETKGITADGKVYIPYESLWNEIDAGFYLKDDGSLVLTLPSETLVWKTEDEGKPVLESGGSIYVSADVLQQNGSLDCEVFHDPERAVVFTSFDGLEQTSVLKEAKVRMKPSGTGNIVTVLTEGSSVYCTGTSGNWTEVTTADGFSGYVQTEALDSENMTAVEHEEDPRFAFEPLKLGSRAAMVWHYVDMQENNIYLDAYLADAKGVNVVSPTWFYVADAAGTVNSYAESAYMETAGQKGIHVWPTIADTEPASEVTGVWLADDNARQKAVEGLMEAADRFGFDGINVDLETVRASEAHDFLQFLRELTAAAHRRNIIVSVDNYVPTHTKYYNRAEQAEIVDYIVVMAYDEHTASSEKAGSVASLAFVRKGIEDTLLEVPAEKLILGVPFYTRTWTEEMGKPGLSTAAVGMEKAVQFAEEHDIPLDFDEACGQYTGTAEDGQYRYSIWMEDETSLEKRLSLVDEYGLAGASAWRIGFESNNIWTVWEKYLGK